MEAGREGTWAGWGRGKKKGAEAYYGVEHLKRPVGRPVPWRDPGGYPQIGASTPPPQPRNSGPRGATYTSTVPFKADVGRCDAQGVFNPLPLVA